jgi:hypothetical protein
MPARFDRVTLDLLDRAMEVDVETMRPDGMPRMTTIWLVVDRGEVFVRSVRGERGYWYQSAREAPDDVSLYVGGRAIPVRVVSVADDDAIDRCSRALESKYSADPATLTMVRPNVLGTTLRLEPR